MPYSTKLVANTIAKRSAISPGELGSASPRIVAGASATMMSGLNRSLARTARMLPNAYTAAAAEYSHDT